MTTSISLKLVIDNKKNRVVFAEADEDFVDILCSFLTLPLGTVVRVLGKQSTVGCVDKLYRSVENLDAKYLQTEACKKMLLEPRSASERLCEDLKLNIDDLMPRRIYGCPTFECFTKTHRLYSSISGTRCHCGKAMDKCLQWTKQKVADGCHKDGVFVKGGKRFVISDGFNIIPLLSTETTLSLLQKNGIDDMDTVETKTVDITRNEILKLLGRLLVSATPLTDVLLPKLDPSAPPYPQKMHITQIKSEEDSSINAGPKSTIRFKLLFNKVNKKVLSAQAGEDFVNVLFSFLTLPLGCIVKLLDMNSSLGCLDNLYKSIESFGKEYSDCIKSEECKNFLLAPKLYPYFGCSNQLPGIEEKTSGGGRAHGCEDCFNRVLDFGTKKACEHNIAVVSITEVNPKLPSSGGGYAKKSVRFTVTDDMGVTPLSSISVIDAIKESKAAQFGGEGSLPWRSRGESTVII